jgi:16S rRNA (cytosine967-C5)-methyltransferase
LSIINTPRGAALTALFQVTEKGAYTQPALEQCLSAGGLNAADKRLTTEIVSGAVRRLLQLDWILNHVLRRPVERLNPWLRNILRLSAYQLLFMQRVPAYAVVHDAVELTKIKAQPGLAGLCNGVLRALSRRREDITGWLEQIPDARERVSIQYSLPLWLLERIESLVPAEDLAVLLDYLNRTPPAGIRVNQLRFSREELADKLRQEGCDVCAHPYLPCALQADARIQALKELDAAGWFSFQSFSSMLAAYILDSQPGQTVCDLCSGVGGKTTHMAEYMRNQGRILALELYDHKLAVLRERCKRLGIDIVEPRQMDVRRAPAVLRPETDAVLLDAPCSGWGVLNRRPDLRYRQRPEELPELIRLQRALLRAAADLIRPGGVLLYATCTFNPAENEEQIAGFLQEDSRYVREGFEDALEFFPLREQERGTVRQGSLTILPGVYGMDGMYYAKLRRKQSG